MAYDPLCEVCQRRLTAGPRRHEGHLSVRWRDDPFQVWLDGEPVAHRVTEAQAGQWGWVAWIDPNGLDSDPACGPPGDLHWRIFIRFGQVSVARLARRRR